MSICLCSSKIKNQPTIRCESELPGCPGNGHFHLRCIGLTMQDAGKMSKFVCSDCRMELPEYAWTEAFSTSGEPLQEINEVSKLVTDGIQSLVEQIETQQESIHQAHDEIRKLRAEIETLTNEKTELTHDLETQLSHMGECKAMRKEDYELLSSHIFTINIIEQALACLKGPKAVSAP